MDHFVVKPVLAVFFSIWFTRKSCGIFSATTNTFSTCLDTPACNSFAGDCRSQRSTGKEIKLKHDDWRDCDPNPPTIEDAFDKNVAVPAGPFQHYGC